MPNKEFLEYFMEETNKRFDKLEVLLQSVADKNFHEIEKLKKFKFTWTGGLIAVNAIITIAIAIYFGRS